MLDLQAPLRHGVDHLDEIGGAAGALHVEGRAGAIGVGHLPAEGLGLGGDDMRGGHGGRRGGAGDETGLDELATIDWATSPVRPLELICAALRRKLRAMVASGPRRAGKPSRRQGLHRSLT